LSINDEGQLFLSISHVVILAMLSLQHALHSVLDLKSEKEWGNLSATAWNISGLRTNLLPFFFLQHLNKRYFEAINNPEILFDKHMSRTMLMEIIEDRHSKRSTIFTSQVPVNKWYEVIGEITIADAILDRIVHDAHRMELKGESLRKKKAEEQTKTDKNETEK
jgi:hypothetical protein